MLAESLMRGIRDTDHGIYGTRIVRISPELLETQLGLLTRAEARPVAPITPSQ